MSAFHINTETGEVGKCSAHKGKCPFGGAADHFDSALEARSAYEASMGLGLASVSRPTEAPTVYDFPSVKLDEAVKRIEAANRKATKAGISEKFSYVVEKYERRTEDPTGLPRVEERVTLTLDRPSLKHDGWTFAGTMTWDPEAGLITRMVPGEELIERPEAERCDVCKTTRHRNDTYLITKEGQQMQVGSACLKRFMGVKPAGLWMLDFDFEIEENEDYSYGSANWRDSRQDSLEIVALALAVADKHGWTSKAQARDSYGERISTSELVEDLIGGAAPTQEAAREREALIAKRENFRGRAKAVLDFAKAIEGESEYATNLRAIAAGESVSVRNLPLLLSAIPQLEKTEQKEKAALEAKANPSQWLGTPGQKLGSTVVTVREAKTTSSAYGTSTLLTLVDDQGNQMKTFYGGNFEPEVGKSYELVSSTVKDHKEWNGVKETMLGRAKFETLRPAELPPTTLPSSSPYGQAWTVEENAKANNKAHREIVKDFKARAGKTGWDNAFNRPLDPDLVEAFRAAQASTNEEFQVRYEELSNNS